MKVTGAAAVFMILCSTIIFTNITARLIPDHSPLLLSDGTRHTDGLFTLELQQLIMPRKSASSCTDSYHARLACSGIFSWYWCTSIFYFTGKRTWHQVVFQVLGALPESLILLASGLLNSKETAQEYVVSGVGLLAGSSILVLTLLWGTCVILGSRDFCEGTEAAPPNLDSSRSRKLQWLKLISLLKRNRVVTDLETIYTARIMALSIIPFVTIQLMKLFSDPSTRDIIIFGNLFVSVAWLLLFFFYQVFQPYIQKRRLEHVKHAHLVIRILRHVQNRTLERLLTDDGASNVEAIGRLFEEIDQDRDDAISPTELKEQLVEANFKHANMSREEAVEEVMQEFDMDGNHSISKEEFFSGFSNWLQQAKREMSKKSQRDLVQAILQNKREERELKQQFVFEILKHVQIKYAEILLSEDGAADVSAIRSLFERVDVNGDNSISQSELKELVRGIEFGHVSFDLDEVVMKIIEVFGKRGEGMISGEDFVTGMTGWLNKYNADKNDEKQSLMLQSQGCDDDLYKRTWQETDKLVDEDKNEKGGGGDNLFWMWVRPISLLLLGIAMLSVLAEPLIESVQNFSEASNIPSFYVSFVLVPLATNSREAVSALKEVSGKNPRITSLTFSEIYGGVFMSNIQGFSVLMALIHFLGRGPGGAAHLRDHGNICRVQVYLPNVGFHLCILFAYPLSLGLIYLLDYVLNYS